MHSPYILCFLTISFTFTLSSSFIAPGGFEVEERDVVKVSGSEVLDLSHLDDLERLDKRGYTYTPTWYTSKFTNPRSTYNTQTLYNGWAADSWIDGKNFTFFNATWTVPPAPKLARNAQLIYFFPSFLTFTSTETSSGGLILQPVLQYGVGYGGGSQTWNYAGWLVGAPDTYITHPLTPVKTGDTLMGIMQSNGVYTTTIGYVNGVMAFNMTMRWSSVWRSAQTALEAYTISNCDSFPGGGTITFSNIVIKDGGQPVTPTWTYGVLTGTHNCNTSTICCSTSCIMRWNNGGAPICPTVPPTTSRPTTAKPTTPKPTTQMPTTQKPTTQKPTTQKPTTQKPTTQKPTTQKPTTQKPTTARPAMKLMNIAP